MFVSDQVSIMLSSVQLLHSLRREMSDLGHAFDVALGELDSVRQVLNQTNHQLAPILQQRIQTIHTNRQQMALQYSQARQAHPNGGSLRSSPTVTPFIPMQSNATQQFQTMHMQQHQQQQQQQPAPAIINNTHTNRNNTVAQPAPTLPAPTTTTHIQVAHAMQPTPPPAPPSVSTAASLPSSVIIPTPVYAQPHPGNFQPVLNGEPQLLTNPSKSHFTVKIEGRPTHP